jgi:FlaA1/EpsC-like NDP-sugar epimerase
MKVFFSKQKILGLNRSFKVFILVLSDFFVLLSSLTLSCYLLLTNVSLNDKDIYILFLSISSLGVLILYFFGVYTIVLRFIDFSSLWKIFIALTIFSFVSSIILQFFILEKSLQIIVLNWVISIFLIITSRLFFRFYLFDMFSSSRVLIYGAGSAGIQLANALRYSSELKPVAFIDEDKSSHGTVLGGLKVYSHSDLLRVLTVRRIDEVLIAMPSAGKAVLKRILEEIENYQVKVRILPGVAELAQGKVSVSELKEVDINDLLGRVEATANKDLINKNIKQKVVLVTGAGGSIGSEISRQVCKNGPKKLIILDSNEFSLYTIKQELESIHSEVKIESILGSVTNKARIGQVCKALEVQTIYHAAAYKHVPLVEENVFEGVFNNIFGTLNCIQAAIENDVETFVFISTDKAVRPTNIMGATKRFAELILQSLSNEKVLTNKTKITIVRFGNVLGSSGSAVPLFQEQIRSGGPLTVTDPEVIRYFMTISEAAELVIQAGAMGEGGEIFVLDMGEPVKILELAKRLIRLSGMEIKDEKNKDGDIEIIFTGLRPGEKLYEELLIGGDVSNTQHKQVLKAKEDFISWKEVGKYLNEIKKAELNSDHKLLRNILRETVTGFQPKEGIVDVIFSQNKDN